MICFFHSIHSRFSVAAWPGNTICYSAMAEAVLAVFSSHSEIGRTRCTTNKIIFVRLHSSFAIPSASKTRLIFGMFTCIKRASRLCPSLAVQFCTLFPTFLFQRCFVPDSHQGAWLKLRRRMVLRHPHLEGQSQHLALFRDRRLTVEPVARGRHCQRVVCVSGGLNCL